MTYELGSFRAGQLVTAAFIFLMLFLFSEIFRNVVLRKLSSLAKKTKSEFDDTVVGAFVGIGRPLFVAISAYAAVRYLGMGGLPLKLSGYLLLVMATYYAVKVIQKVISYFTKVEVSKRSMRGEEAQAASMARLITGAVNLTIWVFAILFLVSNFGFNITSLIAGLGVGGLAVALALQGIFGDLFATISIFFDKPFKAGDFIIVGNDMGSVEHIGLKSTRIKTLQGQQLIISNKELTNSRINNYARMDERRIVFSFGIKYETKTEKAKKVPELVRSAMGKVKMVRLDRVHFREFGSYSLNYEVVYYILSPDYNRYMDCQQEINFLLKEAIESEGIDFAYPTQTVHISK